jgi:hypothetical protein
MVVFCDLWLVALFVALFGIKIITGNGVRSLLGDLLVFQDRKKPCVKASFLLEYLFCELVESYIIG